MASSPKDGAGGQFHFSLLFPDIDLMKPFSPTLSLDPVLIAIDSGPNILHEKNIDYIRFGIFQGILRGFFPDYRIGFVLDLFQFDFNLTPFVLHCRVSNCDHGGQQLRQNVSAPVYHHFSVTNSMPS